jgi:hypothetical protein
LVAFGSAGFEDKASVDAPRRIETLGHSKFAGSAPVDASVMGFEPALNIDESESDGMEMPPEHPASSETASADAASLERSRI